MAPLAGHKLGWACDPGQWLLDGRVAFIDALHQLVLARPGGPPKQTGVQLRQPYEFALSPDGPPYGWA